MPDFKCAACRIRLRSPAGDGAAPPCPICETPLEPVAELSEMVGFRSIEWGESPAEGEPVEPLARPVSDLTKRRETRTEQVDAERWLDDAGSFDTDAVAAALERLPPRPRVDA
jgi:hypothetical protein